MLIIAHVLISGLFLFFAGYGIINIAAHVSKKKPIEHFYLLSPVIGYVFSQLLFFYFYKVSEDSRLSVILTLSTITLINVLYFVYACIRHYFHINQIVNYLRKINFKLLLVLFIIFLLASWQYLLLGEGHYYHSGNEDFFEGIDGGLAYIKNTPLKFIFFDAQLAHVNFHAVIRYQYSSQAFWRLFLGVGGVDAFFLQSIINLILTALSTYWLTLVVFKSTQKAALFAAFMSISMSFYFVTFMTGHIGSMIYCSVAPALLGLTILLLKREIGWIWIIPIFLLYNFVQESYPGPIYYLIIPLIIFFLNNQLSKRYNIWEKIYSFFGISFHTSTKEKLKKLNYFRLSAFLILGAGIMVIASLWLWDALRWYRTDSLLRYNESWKITLYKEMFMVFWGIYPPGSTGTVSILPLFISNEIVNTAALIIALLISSLLLIAAVKSATKGNRQYLLIYMLCFIPYAIVMRYFWGSSYYFYKFLYIHLFLIVIIFSIWIFESVANYKGFKKKILFLGVLVLVIFNITWDVFLGFDFVTRPYHKKSEIKDFFNNVPRTILDSTYLDIPNETNKLAFIRIFRDQGINTQSNPTSKNTVYHFKVKSIQNSTHNSAENNPIVYENSLLSIEKINKHNFMKLNTPYSYEPFNIKGVNINWFGNSYSIAKYKYNSEVEGLVNYIKSKNIAAETYIDIRNTDMNKLVYRTAEENNIHLQNDPEKSEWFVRVLDTGHFTFENLEEGSIYQKSKAEYSEWKNDIYDLVFIPFKERIPSVQKKEIMRKPFLIDVYDFNSLFSFIKSNGGRVFIDIPPGEYWHRYLKSSLIANGIEVTNDPNETTLFFRILLTYPYDKFNFYTIKNSEEELIGYPKQPDNFIEKGFNIALVKIPKKGRSFVSPDYDKFIDYKKIAEGKNPDFSLLIENVTEKAKFLRLIIEPGPSLDFKDFVLKISSNSNKLKRYKVSPNNSLIDIDLNDFATDVKDSTLNLNFEAENVVGRSLMPLEERFLNYAVFALELTAEVQSYSPFLLKAMNHKPVKAKTIIERIFGVKDFSDIINKKDSAGVFIGKGWYQLEEYNKELFRWAGDQTSEIVLNDFRDKLQSVKLDLEPGPSCGGKPLILNAYIQNDFVGKYIVSGRQEINIPIAKKEYGSNQNQIILRLESENDNHRIGSDPRILKYRVFNIALKEKGATDILSPELAHGIDIGSGWYPYEKFNNETFRWAGNDEANLILNAENVSGKKIKMFLEPGPSCAGRPLKLNVLLENKLLGQYSVAGRENIEIQLPDNLRGLKNKKVTLSLRSENDILKISSDPRVLKYRVFTVTLSENSEPDIFAGDQKNNFKILSGWYPYEIYQNQSFRWVGKNPAEIMINKNLVSKNIYFDVEPGPGCGGKELSIDLLVNNKIVKNVKMSSRRTISILLQKEFIKVNEEWSSLKLVPHSENKSIKEDARILNFRVFSISGK